MPYYIEIPKSAELPLPDKCPGCGIRDADTTKKIEYRKSILLSFFHDFCGSEQFTLPLCSKCAVKLKRVSLLPACSLFILFIVNSLSQDSQFHSLQTGIAAVLLLVTTLYRRWERGKIDIAFFRKERIIVRTNQKWYVERVAEINNVPFQWRPFLFRL